MTDTWVLRATILTNTWNTAGTLSLQQFDQDVELWEQRGRGADRLWPIRTLTSFPCLGRLNTPLNQLLHAPHAA
jgi:hypothetical protein